MEVLRTCKIYSNIRAVMHQLSATGLAGAALLWREQGLAFILARLLKEQFY